MSRRTVIPVSLLFILLLIILGSGTFRADDRDLGIVEIQTGPFEVWTVYDGSLESRFQKDIMSLLGGPAAVMELAPRGRVRS